MPCLSSGVTAATGLKSDCITDESTLSDTSSTHGENNAGWKTDYPHATTLTYINIQRSAYLSPRCCHAHTHERTLQLLSVFSALISCSDTQLWPQGLTRTGLPERVCVCVFLSIWVMLWKSMHTCVCIWKWKNVHVCEREKNLFYNLKMAAADSLSQLKWSSSRLLLIV